MDDYDVIVLGTGAAALTAAVVAAEEGARVGVFEKRDTVGGTTVYSGGMIWIPLNQHEPAEKGDSREKAIAYLKALSNGTISDEMVETYVDRGPEMVAYLHDRTPVQFYALPDFPDYHPEQEGGLAAGRPVARDAAVPLRRAGRVEGPRPHLAVLPDVPPHDRPDHARPAGSGGDHARGDAAPHRQRRARHGPGARRPAAQGVPGPRRRAADQPPRRRPDHGGRQGRRRRVRDGRGPQGGPRAERRDRDRRLRAQRGAQAGVPARAVHPHRGGGHQRGRRPEDGHARRRDDRQHARGVVDADDRGAHEHRRDGPADADLRAHAARRDHGQQDGQALHQRGRQLQRLRRRVPRAGHHHAFEYEPALLADLRPDLARQVRLRRRPRRPEKAPTDWITAATPSQAWPRSSGSPATRSRRRSSASTRTRATSRTPTSTAAGAPRTSGGATRRCATARRAPRSDRSRPRPSTRSRSTAARSAPRAARRPTPTPACSTSTATSSRACTPPATPWPRRWA